MTFRPPIITPQKALKSSATVSIATVSIALLTAVVVSPFVNPDMSQAAARTRQIAPDQLHTNINLFTNPIPFVTTDRPRVVPVPQGGPPQSLPLNILLFTNPIPFAQYDWSKGFDVPGLPPQAIPYNYNLFPPPAAIAPFLPVDYSKPFFPLVRIDATQQLNPNLFTNPIPFAQYDWSKPVRLQGALYPAPQQYNQSFFSAPFAQYDWSKSVRLQAALYPAPQPYNQNFYTNPIPFNQQDWSKPQPVPDFQPAISFPPSLSLLVAPVAPPFIPVDYSKPFRVPGLPPGSGPINLNLFTNPIPFAQFDWSKPQSILRSKQIPDGYNLGLYTFIAPAPFFPTDWSKPFLVRRTNPARPTQALNLNLFTNPIPFNQLNWVGVKKPQPHNYQMRMYVSNTLLPISVARPTARGYIIW